MTTPALRFTEFDGDWISSPLKKFFPKIRNGFVGIATPYYVANGVKYLQGKNVKDGRIDPTGLIYISEEFHAKKSNSKLAIDDILMVQSGHVGECAVIDKEYDNANCHALIVLSPHKEQETNSHFVKYYFYTPIGKKIISQIKTGNTIEHVLASEVKEIYLNFPSKVEQTKIASFLSIVDEKIAQLSQKHQLLSQYKEGMMQKLFSQQIRFKADDGSEFEGWEETIFEKIGVFLKGKGISKADIVPDGKIPCIRYGELYTYYGEVISKIISSTNIEAKNLVLSKANDILIPASGETQIDIATASCVLQDNIALSGDLNIFRTKENGIFLSYLIRSKLKMQIAQLAQGNSVVHLYASQLKGVSFSLPCLEEQTKIANFLSAIDQKIEVVAQQIEQAKQWKKGLLQQMFV